jgi:hypothetical protein
MAPGIVGLSGLLAVLCFSFIGVNLSWRYGIIQTQMPVVYSGIEDQGFSNVSFSPKAEVTENTPALLMTKHFFYFGSLSAFTNKFADANNKTKVGHRDGEPQMNTLFEAIISWKKTQNFDDPNQKFILFAPSGEIPATIVAQVIHYLKSSGMFADVILAGGYL